MDLLKMMVKRGGVNIEKLNNIGNPWEPLEKYEGPALLILAPDTPEFHSAAEINARYCTRMEVVTGKGSHYNMMQGEQAAAQAAIVLEYVKRLSEATLVCPAAEGITGAEEMEKKMAAKKAVWLRASLVAATGKGRLAVGTGSADGDDGNTSNFSWSLEQYLSSLNGMFTEDFKDIRARPDDPIDSSIQSDEEKQRSKFLYSLLASLVKQRPLAMVRQVTESNGMEAYRLLVQSLEPASKNRALGLLTMILEWRPFEMRKGSILGQVLRLEEAFVEYEKTGSKLEDNIRFAVLMRCVGGQVKTWLQLNVAESQDYQKLREAIIQRDNATMKWTNVMMLRVEPGGNDGAIPMEIDRIKGKGGDYFKGKGKGKDYERKGKGKGDGKGKSKGKGYGKQQDPGGKAQQKGNGTNDGQKGQKGKADPKVCFTCGKAGHISKDCWQRLRQVSEENTNAKPNAETGTVASSPTTTSQSTSWKSGTVKRVQEVSHPDFENEPMIFDLRPMPMSNLDNKQIRMVQFFSISEEIEPNDDDDKLIYNILTVKQQYHGMENGGPVNLSTEEMGFEVDTGLDLQPKMDDALALREHEIPVEEPQHAMDEAAADAIPAVAEGADGGGAGEQEGRLVLEAGLPDHVVVNDIQLTPTSRLRELRAACHFFGN
eukprot:g18751.t1